MEGLQNKRRMITDTRLVFVVADCHITRARIEIVRVCGILAVKLNKIALNRVFETHFCVRLCRIYIYMMYVHGHRMQFNFSVNESSGFTAYTSPMTTESSRLAETRRLASLKSKQDHIDRNTELLYEEAEKVAAQLRIEAELRNNRRNLESKCQENLRRNSARGYENSDDRPPLPHKPLRGPCGRGPLGEKTEFSDSTLNHPHLNSNERLENREFIHRTLPNLNSNDRQKSRRTEKMEFMTP